MAAHIAFLGNVGVTVPEILSLAQEAEQAGFDGVWMAEYELDTLAIDEAIAMRTERVLTGSCIARAYKRHPLLVAQTATVIDLLAPGRFVIGLGVGGVRESEGRTIPAGSREIALQRWRTSDERAVARMREYIDVIERAFTGEVVSYSGDFYQFEEFQLSLLPTDKVPIFISAGGDQLRRLGGRAADGVFLWLVGEEETKGAVATVKSAAEQAGRDPDAVQVAVLVPVCVSEDRDAARAAARRYLVEFYLGASHYRHVLGRSGFPEASDQVVACLARGDVAGAADAVPDEALDDIAIAGTPEECRDRLREFNSSRGLDFSVLYAFPAEGDWASGYRATIDSFAVTAPV